MTYLKKVLVNTYEEETDVALREAAERWNARVFSKVGIKDILDIDRGKILLYSTILERISRALRQ